MKVLSVTEAPFAVKALIYNREVLVKEGNRELTIKKLRKLDDYLLSVEEVTADVNQVLLEQCAKLENVQSPQPTVTTVLSSTSQSSLQSSSSTS